MSWIFSAPDRWKNEQDLAHKLLLEVSTEEAEDGCAIIRGQMYVQREALGALGPFDLEILYPPDFPERDPNVHLLSHKEWRDEDNHIETDGRFCWVEAKDSPIDFFRQDSLQLLLENIAFRLTQVEMRVRRKLEDYPGPDRAHRTPGVHEAYAARMRQGIGPNTRPCICGRDVKYKYCHGKKEVFRRAAK